jgi:hypothetical protein
MTRRRKRLRRKVLRRVRRALALRAFLRLRRLRRHPAERSFLKVRAYKREKLQKYYRRRASGAKIRAVYAALYKLRTEISRRGRKRSIRRHN